MLLQHVFPDGSGANGTKQYPRRWLIVGFQAKPDNLAHRGIAQQVVADLHGDFHRDACGAFVSLGRRLFLSGIGLAGARGYLFGTVGGAAADVADPVRGLDVAERPLDRLVPHLRRSVLSKQPHGHETIESTRPWQGWGLWHDRACFSKALPISE